MVKKETKIIIAAGGTGGHVFPGIAIAEEIKKSHPEARIMFVGTERGLEAKVLPKLGWQLILVGSTSIKDRKGLRKILALLRVPFSILHAMVILLSEQPKLVISIGGYAAGPISLAAWIIRVPFVLLEPNAIAGFTNRLLGRFTKRAFVALEEARSYFPKGKAYLSGNPVRGEVLAVKRPDFSVKDEITIFVFGGSQGARRINQAMAGAVGFLASKKGKIKILHQTGTRDDSSSIEKVYKDANIEAKVFAFSDRIWEYYASADLVVARAGAISIAELSALALPAILVPYPYAADDHQHANAKSIVSSGGAVMIEDSECTGERLANEIETFVDRPQLLVAMHAALEKIGKPDAAKTIVDESWKLIRLSS